MPTETITLQVEMRDSGKCPPAVEQALKKLPEVVTVEVKFEKRLVIIRGNGVKVEALVEALQKAGYEARVVEACERRGGRTGSAVAPPSPNRTGFPRRRLGFDPPTDPR